MLFVRLASEYKYLPLRNLNVSDIFFLISGCLLAYVMIPKLERSGGKFSYIKYAIYRYLRLMPTVIGCLFFIYLLPLSGDGPGWEPGLEMLVSHCYTNWLPQFTLTSNYDFGPPNGVIVSENEGEKEDNTIIFNYIFHTI